MTRESRWIKPVVGSVDSNGPVKKIARESKQVKHVAAEGTAHATESDWISGVDPTTKRVYYFNTKTKQTSWKKPLEQAEINHYKER